MLFKNIKIMENKKTKKNKTSESENLNTSFISDVNYIDEAIGSIEDAIFNLNKQYETKAENPISSILITLRLVQTELKKIS